MTKNHIRTKLEEHGITQAEAAGRMPDDVGRVGMSFIVTGKVLPTKDSLDALCGMLDCNPTDLYDPDDINLLAVGAEPIEETARFDPSTISKSGRQHDGMCELRAWLRPYEKEALANAVADLGYRSIAEWLREMIRNTVARNKRLQLRTTSKSG